MRNPTSIIKEYNLSTDLFKQPKTNKGKEAIGMWLCRLILLEPGTFSTRPKMGLGLVSRYRNMMVGDLTQLKKDLYHQIETYLPVYSSVDITIESKNHQLIFYIKIDDTVYNYVTVEQEDNKVTLQEVVA